MGNTVSDALSRTMDILKERIGPLAGIYILFFVIQMICFAAFGILGGASAMALGEAGDAAAMGGGFILGLFVFYIVYFLIYCAQSLSMSVKASPLREIDLSDAIGVGFKGSLTMLGAIVILFVVYFVGAIPIGVVVGLLGALSEALPVLALILVVPLVVYLACRISLISPIIAVEGVTNPLAAISKSWAITRGNVLTIFLSYLVLVLLAAIPFAVLAMLFFGTFAAAAAGGSPEAGFGSILIGGVVFIILGIVFASASAALVAVLHAMMTDSEGENLEATFE